jgi:lipid A disaccharide synthetase
MRKQTHLFTGMQVAERQFGVMPQDIVVMEAGTNTKDSFIECLLEKYPRVVAYTIHTIVSKNGNNIDARHLNAPLIWIPE